MNALTRTPAERLVAGLLPLALAGFVGFVASTFLLMGSDSCMPDSAPRICSSVVQRWMVWLPAIGAATGMIAGGVVGVARVSRSRPVGAALGLGWSVFIMSELLVLTLVRS